MIYRVLVFLVLLAGNVCEAQHRTKEHRLNYFRNPLGIPMQLVANFGEVRTDHFHMGFDLRTNQKENLPVYAAAEGFVSKVVIEPSGYGRAVYITHPAGYTTVYAHLNDFFPALHRFVKEKQYRDEQWEQEITFSKNQFPVSKGQFIAYSGNTGASQGPHLHFEIRNTKTGSNINPRLFDFPIGDNIPPFIYKIFLYDRNYSTYVLPPSGINIKGAKGNYVSRDTLVQTGASKISFGISAEDMGNTSSFRFGIHSAEVWIDSIPQISFSLNELNYEDSRYMNAAIDYKKRLTDGTLIQHLSRLPGNRLSIFEGINDGVIQLQDTLPHNIMIIAKDISGNESVVNFKMVWNPGIYQQQFFTQVTEKLFPNKESVFRRDGLEVRFPATALYDTVAFYHAAISTADQALPMHQLHHHYVPVHDAYMVSVTPEQETYSSKIIWRLVSGKNVYSRQAVLRNGKFEGSFNRFGILSLVEDTIPPVLATSGWKDNALFAKNGSLSFIVKDDIGYVESFIATLDRTWLMFSRKGNTFTYKFDEHCTLGMHTLNVAIKDNAGNETIRSYGFELREKLPVKKSKKKRIKKRKR